MKQHNHWKLSQLQKGFVKVVLWGFGLVLLVFDLILQKTLDFDMLSQVVGVISIVFGFVLTLIDRFIWKTKIMNLPFLEEYWTPILEGRWTGELIRDGISHNFVIEIKQRFTSISCITYSKHSSSSAYAAEILYNDQLETYKLIYYWQAGTTNVDRNIGDSDTFDGFTVLDILVESGKATKLKGSYFTDRQPKQTRGKLYLEFQQKELINSFE